MTTPDPIEELEALLAKAKHGEWLSRGSSIYIGALETSRCIAGAETVKAAALIVAAVNALPDLLRRLREAEADKARAVREAFDTAARVASNCCLNGDDCLGCSAHLAAESIRAAAPKGGQGE